MLKTTAKIFPEILILSTQRSGTHLLESFLNKHSKIHPRGEIIIKYKRTGTIDKNHDSKMNIAILMQSQLSIFKELGGNLSDSKIIHLSRNSHDVALSRLQLEADRRLHGKHYKVHFHKGDELMERGLVDRSKFKSMLEQVVFEQQELIKILKNIDHFHLNYEDIVPDNQNTEFLSEDIQEKLLQYLGLENTPNKFYTTFVKR